MSTAAKKREHGSGSGTEIVYVVEARSTYSNPQEANGMILDCRWRQVRFDQGPIGVKNNVFSAEAQRDGRFLSYSAALALSHWFLANGGLCIETRMVKIKLTHSYSTEEEGVSAPMSHWRAGAMAAFRERSEEPQAVDAVDPHVQVLES